MTKKYRKDRYGSPADSSTEKLIPHMSATLIEPKLEEYSEISHGAAGADYSAACNGASLIPVQNGWGLFHCTVRDKRRRRARITLATRDLTYHRAFIAAASYPSRGAALEIALARYPYMRRGWPGPPRQGGSWIGGEPIPWRPTYLGAAPQRGTDAGHLHGIQASASGLVRQVCAVFAKSENGVDWTMLDDEPVQELSKVVLPASGTEIYFAAGVAVMPGWLLPSEPKKCDSCASSQ
jgi:hypothetical protein